MSFFENAWWKDEGGNLLRNPEGGVDYGGLLSGFGQHLVDNLVPYQKGKDGNLMPREAYDPYNLTNIGLLGMQSGMGYVPGRTARGGQTEYTGNFADYLGNINRSLQGQMMNQQKLLDSSLARQLTGAKIGALKRKNLMPEIFKWDSMENGKRITNQIIMNPGGKNQLIQVPKDAPPGVGTTGKEYPFTDTKGEYGPIGKKYIAIDYVNEDGSRQRQLRGDYRSVKSYRTSEQAGFIDLDLATNNMLTDDKDLLNETTTNTPGAFANTAQKGDGKIWSVDTGWRPKDESQHYETLKGEYEKDIAIFDENARFTGTVYPKGEGGKVKWKENGLFDRAILLGRDPTNFGGQAAIAKGVDQLAHFIGIPHTVGQAEKLNTLTKMIKMRIMKATAGAANMALSSRLLDTAREKQWLASIAGIDTDGIQGWFQSQDRFMMNMTHLRNLERKRQSRLARVLSGKRAVALSYPHIKRLDDIAGNLFDFNPGGYAGSNIGSGWSGGSLVNPGN